MPSHPPTPESATRPRRWLRLLTALTTAAATLTGAGAATVAVAPSAAAESNGVGGTPALGWSSWSYIRHDPTAANIEAQARAMVSSGLASAGYLYVNVDDFWYDCPGSQGPDVDSYGRWVTNSTSFPPSASGENGIAVVADYVHSLGLKFGLYVTPGISDQAVSANTPIEGTSYTASEIADGASEANYNCGGMQGINYSAAGAQAYINSWADEFASWGVDYLKLDGVGDSDVGDVQAWSTALQQSGRAIHLELSNSLDIANAATWAQYSNGWRTGGDIECYCGTDSSGNPQPLTTWGSVQGRFAQVANWQPYGGPGAFNDYDSIEFGDGSTIDGLSTAEGQSQYGLWAMAASPLLLGVDLTKLNSTEAADLENRSIIAVDQDGIDARRIVSNVNQQAFAKTEQNGDVILGLFNYSGSGSQTVTVSLAAAGITGSATATNLWTGASAGTLSGTYSVTLAAGASQILRLKPVAGTQGSTTYLAASSTNTLSGGATVASCNSCLGGQKVGFVGNGGTLTFNNVNVSAAGNYEVQIDYLDGTSGTTTGRSTTLTVNGTAVGTLTDTPTGSFANPGSTTVSLPLNAGSNTIELSNAAAYAPDFEAIAVPTNPTTSSTTYLAASSANTLSGGAVVQSCSACNGGEKVGYVGNGSGTLTFNQVSVSKAGVYPVQIVYCDGSSGTTGRSATFTVDGTVVQTNVFTPTGGFSTPATVTDYLPLQAGSNTIEISNGSAYAPDFNAIVVNQ
ncbi:alpha-galactosidase [Actinospica sp. MGRD01-02]|uniref:Alpha-galactosidase n=1 Tax=Actinospica acidithermotolerans TaxID=2828514 RepID=A0A941IPK6_9ACTN|nr:CBM35 domain-containing protein [Actinospica acidithermotolerans]MBR7830531.1 alpha-galactosidase [Actinospica acidithermotolerans]